MCEVAKPQGFGGKKKKTNGGGGGGNGGGGGSYFPARVTRYNSEKNSLLLTYEDFTETWHALPKDNGSGGDDDDNKDAIYKVGYEGMFDGGKYKFKVTALNGFSYGEGEDSLYAKASEAFPAIPMPLQAARTPKEIKLSAGGKTKGGASSH